jgi:hypothetical protein
MHAYWWRHNETTLIQVIRTIRVAKKCIWERFQLHIWFFFWFTCILLTRQTLTYQCICNIHFLKNTVETWGETRTLQHKHKNQKKEMAPLLRVPSAVVPACPQLQVQVHLHIRFKNSSPSMQEHPVRTYRGETSKGFTEAIHITPLFIIHPICHRWMDYGLYLYRFPSQDKFVIEM